MQIFTRKDTKSLHNITYSLNTSLQSAFEEYPSRSDNPLSLVEKMGFKDRGELIKYSIFFVHISSKSFSTTRPKQKYFDFFALMLSGRFDLNNLIF